MDQNKSPVNTEQKILGIFHVEDIGAISTKHSGTWDENCRQTSVLAGCLANANCKQGKEMAGTDQALDVLLTV